MNLADSIAKANEIQRGARGPKRNRRWQKLPPPGNPISQPLRPVGMAPPVPINQRINVPQRPLPPIAIGSDSVDQFSRLEGVPQRRIFGPTPLL